MPTLLERDDHLAQLAGWFADAADGHGSVVLVSGEAGAGKTSLVHEFARDADLLCGWCEPLVTPRPLGPLLDIAHQVRGDFEARVRSAGDPFDAYAAVLDLLREQPEPTVVLLEDLHWADDATIDMVRFLGRRIAGTRALLVVTYRSDEITAEHSLTRALADLARQPHTVHRLQVAPLSPAAVAELTGPTGIDPVALHAATGGNAFFVTEVVAAGGGVPATVQAAVLGRLAGLGQEARALVDATAAEPRGLDLDLVEPWTGLSPDFATSAELAGVLFVDGGAVRFRHDLARLAAYGAVAEPARRTLHARMVALLEERAVADPARLAHHALASGEEKLILHHAVRAGREALRLGAASEAVSFLRAAEGLGARLPTAERVDLLLLLSDALTQAGDVVSSVAAASEAVLLAERDPDPVLAEQARVDLARNTWRAGDPAGARELLALSVRTLLPLGPRRELATALRAAGRHAMFARQHETAVDHARRAASLSAELGDAEGVELARLVEGTAELVTGDADRGIALLAAVVEWADRGEERRLAQDALSMLASGTGEIRRYHASRSWLLELLDRAGERDYTVAYALTWQARLDLEQGHWAAASDAASALSASDVPPVARLTALGVLGRLRVRRGDPRPEEPLDTAIAMGGMELQHRWPSVCALAELAWLSDGPPAPRAVEVSSGGVRRVPGDRQPLGEG